METILICPGERPGVSLLTQHSPLASLPVLGQGLVEYWLAHLASTGVKSVLILASDRSEQVRQAVGTGSRWGLSAHVVAEERELSVSEALSRYPEAQVYPINHFPEGMHAGLFRNCASWFAGVEAWMPRAITPERVGIRETQLGLYMGMNSHIDPEAEIQPPCWIGSQVVIGAGCRIGPHAIIEDRVFIEPHATVAASFVGSDTYVGRQTDIHLSIVLGDCLIHWRHNSQVRVTDPFILSSLRSRRNGPGLGSWLKRVVDRTLVSLRTEECTRT